MIVKVAAVPNLVLIVTEAVFTGFAASFLVRVYPEALSMPRLVNEQESVAP